jgi:beta-phosphoglucomutase-like phosphatase (HAD superfamily)
MGQKGLKAIVFDFNGTLFFDADLQEEAWRRFFRENAGREVTYEELQEHMHGRNAAVTFKYFLGREFSREEVDLLVEKKEVHYRALCHSTGRVTLAEGVPAFLDYLKDKGIPIAIATASPKGNVDFYFETFSLDRWFGRKDIIYDDGSFRGKPEPDIYLKAIGHLGLSPEEVTVFEDASSGITSAVRAGAGRVIGVSSMLSEDTLLSLGADSVIRGYGDSPEKLFDLALL